MPPCFFYGAIFDRRASAGELLSRLNLPPGFTVSHYATGVANARQMAVSSQGIVYVGSRTAGKIYALMPDADGSRAARVIVIARGLNAPNGVAWYRGDLYVAEVSRILRYRNIDRHVGAPPEPEIVTDRFPKDGWHGSKFIRFGPDGWLYVPVGAPCNICEPEPDKYALISRIRPDGSQYEVVARGVRNSVGFDFEPGRDVLWFTDNGRDRMGDDIPSCELNRVAKAGEHFGFPYCHQGDIADPEFGYKRDCLEFTPPAIRLGGHVAPLGMRFYTGAHFPAEYKGDILLALHGSWNRSKKSGYKVVRVKMEGGEVKGMEDFLTGFLQNEKVLGRPVDIEQLPDGSVLVSDDMNGAVYRISRPGVAGSGN